MPTFCMFENRESCAAGLQLLLASLARTAPGSRVVVGGVASDGPTLQMAERLGLEAHHVPRVSGKGWDVKPELLLAGLERVEAAGDGDARVTWIDADIIVTRDVRPMLAALPDDAVLIAAEHRWGQHRGGDHRARAWGLTPGRALPDTANSCFVSVNRRHRPLLDAWQELLNDPHYREAQARHWRQRPIHTVGDQELLSALLGSDRFADPPLRWLRPGRDIIQAFGPASFGVWDRLRVAAGHRPLAVHAMGPHKPWDPSPAASLRQRYLMWHNLTMLYTAAAAGLLDDLPDESRRGPLARPPRLGYAGQALAGLPVAAVDGVVRALKKSLGIDRYLIDVDPRDTTDREPFHWVDPS